LRSSAAETPGPLLPVHIEIDNDSSEQFTVLKIQSEDTSGFLYELTNALAFSGVYISRVRVQSSGNEVFDTLLVTDGKGQKIIDPQKQRELQAATVLIKHFTHLVPRSPNPEAALLHFRDFVGQLFTRPEWTSELASLETSGVLDALARLLGVSDFLWNDFLRMQHANLFPVVRNIDALAAARSRETLAAELHAALQAAPSPEARREALNAFKDREMFRVDMRHILGHIRDFHRFSEELTDVAEAVVSEASQMCLAELTAQYGVPQLKDGSPAAYSVCALGKCGGRELGFASDIELMFVYVGEGKTSGPHSITTTELYVKLVESVTHAIRAQREGIFEIDLRLRPFGRAGSLAVTVEAFRSYFGPQGAAWPYERQALVKLRPIAGDSEFGKRIVALRDELIYSGEPFDVAAMRGMRERQIRQLVAPGTFNAKLGPGGLVDTEYLVQGLQITHGRRDLALRSTNTLAAIDALAEAGILAPGDAEKLRAAYNFLRQLIGALRIVRGNAKDLAVPPADTEEYAFLARRLGYDENLSKLRNDLDRHVADVLELSQKLLG
jgi:glutamate-ammonia-ligase adenylyltransferase